MPGRAAEIAPATSPSVMNRMRAPASRTSRDQLLVARPVEDADGDVLGMAVLGLRHPADVLGGRRGDVDDVGGLGAGGDLLHVEHGGRVEHRAALGDGDDRDRVRHALGHQRRAVDRVDRDVAQRAGAVADLLAVVEHRRFVLLALADDDDAAHRHGADQRAHRVDRRAVPAVLVAATDPAAGRHRGRLGDADELEGQVAVRRLAVDRRGRAGADAHRSAAGGHPTGRSCGRPFARRRQACICGQSVRPPSAGRPLPSRSRVGDRALSEPRGWRRRASAGRCRRAPRRAPTAPATPRALRRRTRAGDDLAQLGAGRLVAQLVVGRVVTVADL